MAEPYDVTIATVRPGTHPQALARLEKTLVDDLNLLACWYSEIGALNRILIIRKSGGAAKTIADRFAVRNRRIHHRTFARQLRAVDFMPPLRPGAYGPCYEVRSYVLKPDGLAPTIELWRKAVPRRAGVSPLLAAMVAATGAAIRFMHVWPYKTYDERARLREKAVADGVWPPPGGPGHLVSQQADIYLPAAFSPMR